MPRNIFTTNTVDMYQTLKDAGVEFPTKAMYFLNELFQRSSGAKTIEPLFDPNAIEALTPIVKFLLSWLQEDTSECGLEWRFKYNNNFYAIINNYLTFAIQLGEVDMLATLVRIVQEHSEILVKTNKYFTKYGPLAEKLAEMNMLPQLRIVLGYVDLGWQKADTFLNPSHPEVMKVYFEACAKEGFVRCESIVAALSAENSDDLLKIAAPQLNDHTLLGALVSIRDASQYPTFLKHFNVTLDPIDKVSDLLLIANMHLKNVFSTVGALEGVKILLQFGVPYSYCVYTGTQEARWDNGKLLHDMLSANVAHLSDSDQKVLVDDLIHSASTINNSYQKTVNIYLENGIAPKMDYDNYKKDPYSGSPNFFAKQFKQAAFGTHEAVIKFSDFHA